MSDRHPRIVVGYDGSAASRAALAVAKARAGDGGEIVVIHAYDVPRDYYGTPYMQQLLDKALDRANAVVAGLPHETQVIGAPPARAIADAAAAREADEIIIGTRGFGRARALLGSVAHELIHLAECPVTVIPERAAERAEAAALAATAAA